MHVYVWCLLLHTPQSSSANRCRTIRCPRSILPRFAGCTSSVYNSIVDDVFFPCRRMCIYSSRGWDDRLLWHVVRLPTSPYATPCMFISSLGNFILTASNLLVWIQAPSLDEHTLPYWLLYHIIYLYAHSFFSLYRTDTRVCTCLYMYMHTLMQTQ